MQMQQHLSNDMPFAIAGYMKYVRHANSMNASVVLTCAAWTLVAADDCAAAGAAGLRTGALLKLLGLVNSGLWVTGTGGGAVDLLVLPLGMMIVGF